MIQIRQQSINTVGPQISISKIIGLVVAVLLVLILVGCENIKTSQRESWVKDADVRWLKLRSALIGKIAQGYFDSGDLEQAENHLIESMILDPDNADLHCLSGRIALERGQLERSYHRLCAAINLNEELPEAHYYLGLVLQRWQQYDKAFDRFDRAFQLQADNPNYLLAMAEMYINMDELDAALTLLDSKLIYFEQTTGICEGIGQIYMLQRQFDKAIEYYQKASLLEPDDLAIRKELATACIAAGQINQAVGILKSLIGLADGSKKAEGANQINHRTLQFALADCYFIQERHREAESIYISLTRKNATDVEAWIKLGELAWRSGDLKAAYLAAQRAISVAPKQYEGYLLAGLILEKRGQLEQAAQSFGRAADVAEDESRPLILRGLVLEQMDKVDQAAKAYAGALRRSPQESKIRKLLANLERRRR